MLVYGYGSCCVIILIDEGFFWGYMSRSLPRSKYISYCIFLISEVIGSFLLWVLKLMTLKYNASLTVVNIAFDILAVMNALQRIKMLSTRTVVLLRVDERLISQYLLILSCLQLLLFCTIPLFFIFRIFVTHIFSAASFFSRYCYFPDQVWCCCGCQFVIEINPGSVHIITITR